MATPSKKYDRHLSISNSILSTIAYFDIFSYPLKKREIGLFLTSVYDEDEFEIALQNLVNSASIFKLGEFYSLENNYSILQRRINGNQKAKDLLKKAERVALILSKFPYVRGVAVSGSLSKNFADENSDIDLFIIVSKDRLWVARTFMHIFKKLTFLINKQHLFCMNYFVEEDHLDIEEKNIYTATEIATLMPLQGSVAFEKFYAENKWINTIFPNKYMRVSSAKKIKNSWIKWVIEKLLNNFIGTRLDDLFMRITAKRWASKTLRRKMNQRGSIMGMSAAKHCAKPAPVNFQNKFIDLYERKVIELLHKKKLMMKPVR